MSGTGRAHLKVNNTGYDTPFFENARRLISYREPTTVENHVIEQIDLTPSSNANTWTYGNTIKFQLERRIDYAGDIEFIYTRSADLTGNGAAFLDFEGLQSIDYVEIYSDNVTPFRFYGEHMLFDLLQESPYIERHVSAESCLGYRYPSERAYLATQQQTVIVKLRIPFNSGLDRTIPCHTFSSRLNIDITLKSLKDCCRGSSNSTFNITNPFLRIQGTHLTQESKMADYSKIWSDTGLPIKIKDRELHRRENLTATSGIQRIKLQNIKNAVYNLKFILRSAGDVNNNAGLQTTNFYSTGSYWLEDGHERITPVFEMNDPTVPSTSDYSLCVNNHRMYPMGQKGLAIGTIPFCPQQLVVPSEKDCFGSRLFNGYNNLELVFDFKTAPSVPLVCDVIGEIHQIAIWQNGSLRPYVK